MPFYGLDRAGNKIQERLPSLQQGLGKEGKDNAVAIAKQGAATLLISTSRRWLSWGRAALEEWVVADEATLTKQMGIPHSAWASGGESRYAFFARFTRACSGTWRPRC
jgi:hypothetical protein